MGERGFGLGLKLTKEFVDQNKGTISVTSEPGKGTCFVLGFPSQAKGVERRLDSA